MGYVRAMLNREEKEEQTETKEKDSTQTVYPAKSLKQRLSNLELILRLAGGGLDVSSRIDPILTPKNFKTTTILTKGEVSMCSSLLSFSSIALDECEPVISYVETFCFLKLSEAGFGIEQAIKLGQALTQESMQNLSYVIPDRPNRGQKEKPQ